MKVPRYALMLSLARTQNGPWAPGTFKDVWKLQSFASRFIVNVCLLFVLQGFCSSGRKEKLLIVMPPGVANSCGMLTVYVLVIMLTQRMVSTQHHQEVAQLIIPIL